MTIQIFMTGEDGSRNMGDIGQALACAVRLRHYFPDAQLVATGLDLGGAALRHDAQIVPWPLQPSDFRPSFTRQLGQKVTRKLRKGEDLFDPAARDFNRIFNRQYRADGQFRSAVEKIERADFVFDMGHGGLNDVFDPFVLCFVYYLAGRLGRPLFISGQSIGPLWRARSIKMVHDTLPHAHTVGLRDREVSYRILVDQVGVDADQIRLREIGDDTLDLSPQEPDWEEMPHHLADIVRSGEFFAVQWRSSDYTQSLINTDRLVPLIRSIEHIHQATGLPCVFVPLSWESRSSDVLTAVRIAEHLNGKTRFHVVWNYMEASEIKWLLGRARFGLGVSYHFHIFLLSQGVPSIGIYPNSYYRIKLDGAFAAFNFTGVPLRYPDELIVTNPSFQKAVSLVTDWSDRDRDQMVNAADSQRRKWHEAFRLFLEDTGLVDG